MRHSIKRVSLPLQSLILHYINWFLITKTDTRGFDLPKMMGLIQTIGERKLSQEWESQIGGGRSNVVLIIPYTTATMPANDEQLCKDYIEKMRERIPDMNILFLTMGSKDRWAGLTLNPADDIFSIGPVSIHETAGTIINLTNRMKRSKTLNK